jgi:CRISPR-associated protein Cas2
MKDHGVRLQYSVFLCHLGSAELAELEAAVTAVVQLRRG